MSAVRKSTAVDAGTSTPAAARSAIRSPLAIAAFVLIVAAGLAADLLSKHLVFKTMLSDPAVAEQIRHLRRLPGGGRLPTREILKRLDERKVCPGVKFTLSTNPGIVFGLPMPRWAVAAATVVTIGLVFFFFATSDAGAWAIRAAMGLILAGALGNLYDRLFSNVSLPSSSMEPIRYQVRDFIDCSDLYYPYIFNVADVLLVLGAGVLIVHWLCASRSLPGKTAKSKN